MRRVLSPIPIAVIVGVAALVGLLAYGLSANEPDRGIERAIAEEQTRAQGKPEAMIEKIVDGKIKAFYKEVALIHQPWVREPKQTIAQVLADAGNKAGGTLTVTKFVRYQLGQE